MDQESVLMQEKRSIALTGQDSSQKIALLALEKQKQVIKLKEYLLLAGFSLGGAFLRVPMQVVPSAEPISFFAILSGWLFGSKKGFIVGASALLISNFLVFGGQGPWTPFQLVAVGVIGYMGGFLRKKASVLEVVGIAVAGTLLFEVIMSISSLMIFPFGIFAVVLSGIPFLIVHLVSNSAFAMLLPKARRWVYEKGGFHERELCDSLISRIRDSRRSKAVRG